MVETVIAVLIITSIFLGLFSLSQLLTRKIVLEHAAMRVARARTVGFNDFMCRKAARVAVIPIAGKQTWPEGRDFDYSTRGEIKYLGDYLASENGARARGVLEYADWDSFVINPGDGGDSRVSFDNLEGRAGIEKNASLYLMDSGQ